MDTRDRTIERAETLFSAMAVSETPDDFTMALVTRVFIAEKLRMAFMFDTAGTTELRRIGGFGDPRTVSYPPTVSMWSDTSLTVAFREDRVVRVNDLEEYRRVFGASLLHLDGEGFLAIPLHERGRTVGALSLVFSEPLSTHSLSDVEVHMLRHAAEHVMHDWRRYNATQAGFITSASRPLTERQIQVLGHLNNGHSLREIAGVFNVSEATVKSDVQKIYRAFGVNKKSEALILAHRMGVIQAVEK